MNLTANNSLLQVRQHLLHRRILMGLFFVVATFVLLFMGSTAAFAGAIGWGDNGGRPPGQGGTQPVNPNEPTTPNPGRQYSGTVTKPAGNIYYSGCTSWGGSGSFRPSSNCTVTKEALYSKGAAKRGNTVKNWGRVADVDAISLGTMRPVVNWQPAGPTLFRDWDSARNCGPQGTKSAVGQKWKYQVYRYFQNSYSPTWSASQQRWVYPRNPTVRGTEPIGEYFIHEKVGCSYPFNSQAPNVTCFWNYDGEGWYSTNRRAALSTWTHFADRAALGSDPRAPRAGTGTGNVAPSCDRTGTASVRIDTNTAELAYYRLAVSWSQKTFRNVQWKDPNAGNRVVWNNWTSGNTLPGGSGAYFAYSCLDNSPNLLEGPFLSQSSIPNRDQFLNSANCVYARWECEIAKPTALGHDAGQVDRGQVNPRSTAYVLRNGEKVPATMAVVRIVDLTGNARRDVTNGNAGTGVRNITSIEYRNSVTPGSTPWQGDQSNPKEANRADQFFQLYRGPADGSGTRENNAFNVWRSGANLPESINRSLAFQWASDPGAEFSLQREWRVTGEFRVPSGRISSTGSSAISGYQWIEGTYNCMEYTGSGSNRVKTGRPLIAQSNDVVVVRSVNDIR